MEWNMGDNVREMGENRIKDLERNSGGDIYFKSIISYIFLTMTADSYHIIFHITHNPSSDLYASSTVTERQFTGAQ